MCVARLLFLAGIADKKLVLRSALTALETERSVLLHSRAASYSASKKRRTASPKKRPAPAETTEEQKTQLLYETLLPPKNDAQPKG